MSTCIISLLSIPIEKKYLSSALTAQGQITGFVLTIVGVAIIKIESNYKYEKTINPFPLGVIADGSSAAAGLV